MKTTHLFGAASLRNIEDAGHAVLILTEGLEREELLSSRLTRAEVVRQLGILGASLANLPGEIRSAMPELGWDGWYSTMRLLGSPGSEHDEALWFAVLSLVPATLMWLRIYRKNQPELFDYAA